MRDHELAAELRELADHPHLVIRRRQLLSLSRAVIERSEAERWCEVDLFAAFSPDETVVMGGRSTEKSPHGKRRNPSRGLRATIGSVLVFLPIFFTWLGLKMATSAYGDVLDSNGPEAVRRPFLEMWQQGFDGRLPGIFRFDNVALCTVAAIVFLVGWTVWESIGRNSAEDKAEQELDKAERELVFVRARLRNVLTEVSLMLGQVRLSSPMRFSAELTKAAAHINDVGDTARKVQTELVKTLTETLQATERSTEALVAGAIDVQGAVESLDRHLTDINTASAAMVEAVERSVGALSASVSNTGQAVTGIGDRLSTTISQSTLEMQRAFNDELARSTASVHGAVVTLDTRIGELINTTAIIGYAVNRAAVSIDSVGSSTEKAVGLIGERVTDTLNSTAAEFRQVFGNTGTEIRESLDNWTSTAGAHASRIEIVSDTSGRTVLLLEQTRETLDRLPAAITDVLADLPSKVKELTDGEFSELKHAVIRLHSAVDRAADVIGVPSPPLPPGSL